MSRHIPTVKRREIIYRRSYIDEHNDRFDNAFPQVMMVKKPEQERPPTVLVSNNYPSDVKTHERLDKIESHVDKIVKLLQNVEPAKTSHKEEVTVDQLTSKLQLFREICDRLERLERESGIVEVKPQSQELVSAINELAEGQKGLQERILKIENQAHESVDDLLNVINDTRRDMEEKISNIKQLSDGNWIHLDDKMDGFQRHQNGLQLQINQLMTILTASSSRPSSVNEKSTTSRSSSKSSVRPTPAKVFPTTETPVQFAPSVRSHSSASKKSGVKKPESIKSISTITSLKKSPILEIKTEKVEEIEVLRKQPSIETLNKLHAAANKIKTPSVASSGSFIDPLPIDERRNSQPANIFLSKHHQ